MLETSELAPPPYTSPTDSLPYHHWQPSNVIWTLSVSVTSFHQKCPGTGGIVGVLYCFQEKDGKILN